MTSLLRQRPIHWGVSAAAVLVALVLDPQKVAASPSPSSTDAKASSTERAFEEEQWSVAIALIEAQPSSNRTPADWLRLARSRARLGLLVEAYEAYDRHQELNLDPAQRAVAAAEAEALAVRLSWLTILVPDDLHPGDRIWIDQHAVDSERLASPYPLNAGAHSVLLERAGHAQWGYRIHVAEADRQTVDLRDATSQPKMDSPERAIAGQVLIAGGSGQTREAPASGWSNPLRTTAYIGLVLGGVSTALGTGLAFNAASFRNDIDSLRSRCDVGNCGQDDRIAALRSRERMSSRGAAIGLVAGSLGLLTGGVLLLLSSDDDSKQSASAWRMGADPALDVANVTVSKAF